MSLLLKLILGFLGLAYLISPIDLIPDLFIPYLGYLDDLGIISTIIYILVYQRLPKFFPKKLQDAFNAFKAFYSQGQNKKQTKASQRDYTSFKDQQTQYSSARKPSANDPKRKTVPSPHDILGIPPTASIKEIQAAYKSAIKKYHPDKVSHLGQEFRDLANEKFVEIQNAYNTLMSNR